MEIYHFVVTDHFARNLMINQISNKLVKFLFCNK